MNKKGRIALRNSFTNFLNAHPYFGCKVQSGPVPAPKKRVRAKERHFWRFVSGTAKDGRTILIYPLLSRNERIPIFVCEYMNEIAKLSPYVGAAETLGDVFCILKNNPVNYKRAEKTWYFKYWLSKHLEKKNGSSTKDPSP